MRSHPTLASLVATLALACLACNKPAPEAAGGGGGESAPAAAGPAISGETRSETADGLTLVVPVEWTRAPVRSSMRKAEFVLPGPAGEARLVVYRFEGGAGSAAQNIQRWRAQIEGDQPVETATLEVDGLSITSVDARGRFAGQRMPGAPEQPPIDDARLFAAAIEGAGDPYYLKLVGPTATIDPWAPAWTKLLSELATAP